MLGLGDFGVALVFILLFASTLLCVVYGIMNWNKDGDDESLQKKEEKWDKEEHELEETL